MTGAARTVRLDFARDGAGWPYRQHSVFVSAAGRRWHVQHIPGPAGAPLLLLLHGTGASTHSWAPLVPYLMPYASLIIPDLPGHGFSDRPATARMTLPAMAADLATLMASQGWHPSLIAGHSAGGAIALAMTLAAEAGRGLAPAPRAVVGINAALAPFSGLAALVFPALARALVINPVAPSLIAWRARRQGAVAGVLAGTGTVLPPERLRFYETLLGCEAHAGAALAMMAQWDLRGVVAALPRLHAQLTLIVGEGDRAVPPAIAEGLHKRLPALRLVRLAGLGHLAHEEDAQGVAPALIAGLGLADTVAPAAAMGIA